MLYFILEFVGLLLVLLIATGLLYLFTKRWKEISFKQVFKAIVVYALGAALVYVIYPSSISFGLGKMINLIISMLAFAIIAYFVFYFAAQKFISFSWKGSLIAFLVMSIIVFPLLSQGKVLLENKIMELPVFEKKTEDMDLTTLISLIGSPTRKFLKYPGVTTLNYINTALLWVPNYMQRIIISY